MKFIKSIFTLIGVLVVFGVSFAYIEYGLESRIGQVSKFDSKALNEYMQMFDRVMTSSDYAKGMVRKVKMIIPKGMDKQKAFENAIEVMDEIAGEYGLTLIDENMIPRNGKLFKEGGLLAHIRSYCSLSIADVFLGYSSEFIGFMPCRIGFVEEPNGDIYIYTTHMELMINGGKPLPPKLLDLANEMKNGMYTMMEEAASAGQSL